MPLRLRLQRPVPRSRCRDRFALSSVTPGESPSRTWAEPAVSCCALKGLSVSTDRGAYPVGPISALTDAESSVSRRAEGNRRSQYGSQLVIHSAASQHSSKASSNLCSASCMAWSSLRQRSLGSPLQPPCPQGVIARSAQPMHATRSLTPSSPLQNAIACACFR